MTRPFGAKKPLTWHETAAIASLPHFDTPRPHTGGRWATASKRCGELCSGFSEDLVQLAPCLVDDARGGLEMSLVVGHAHLLGGNHELCDSLA